MLKSRDFGQALWQWSEKVTGIIPGHFLKNHQLHCNWCADTRSFVPNPPKQTEAEFSLALIASSKNIEALLILLKNDHVILVGHSIHAFMALE
ncbi:MAG: hypothetical protein BGO07_04300 [Alphaproteobacteria bacterium 40-19]|nr:MAG: hypothetical protein BGO07_04300 [Alphaproteobacteria bacterium 40-19]